MTPHIIDGKRIAAELRAEIKREVEALKHEHGVTPRIVFILVGENPSSEVYVRNKGLACEEAGFSHETLRLPSTILQNELLARIEKINRDRSTHGLLVQLPLPPQIDSERVIEAIDPAKDVDGFHPMNAGRLLIGTGNFFVPCTPAGILEMLKRENISVSGKHAVIVGRSNIVGKPLAMLLAQKGAHTNAVVTIAHTGAGAKLADITRSADILIAAMGAPQAIKGDMVRDGVIVIDVGTNRIDDSTKKNGYRLVGDVDFEAVSKKASAITPVPGGVGPMTIAMLLKNTLTAAKQTVNRTDAKP